MREAFWKRRGFSRRLRESVAGYLFLLPWLVGFVGVVVGPMAASLYLSFTDYSGGDRPLWIGLENYQRALEDPRMWAAAKVTLTYVATAVPCVVGTGLLLALLLNRGTAFLPVYRAVFYMPTLIGGSVAIALLWRQVFGSGGLVNSFLTAIGFPHTGSWIGSPDTALGTLVVLQTWQFGSGMLIFLAGLRQIPRSYYEAASMDGATWLQQFRFCTLPALSPLILFNPIMAMIAAFQAFNAAYIVSSGSGGPADSTLFFTLYIYQQGFVHFDFGYASALGWMLILTIAAAVFVLSMGTRRFVHYGDET